MIVDQTSLDSIDPKEAWQPWRPGKTDPWNRKWAAHLYRRAGFGASPADLVESQRLGFEGTIDLLLKGKPEAAELRSALEDVGQLAAKRGEESLRDWWLYTMLHSQHPLREKLTLFWHNHFATSIAKVLDAPLMYRQNCLLREHALGKFEPFLQAISKDPAMLTWLDSNRNVKGKPNENYARELMELFSLGVGNYTEKDIREAARAFTGWHTVDGEFRFIASLHDSGPKTFFGQTGPWDGSDIVRTLLTLPTAARFIVRKLYTHFISEKVSPPDALLEPLCTLFRKSGYDIAMLVKTMLGSRHFFSAHAFRQRIKSPVEFVLGGVLALSSRGTTTPGDHHFPPTRPLVARLSAMSQKLFSPPNVKGWAGGKAWLTTSTMLERDNFAEALAMGTLWNSPSGLDPAKILAEVKARQPEDIVRALLDLHVPGDFPPAARARLIAFVAEDRPSGADLERRVREVVHAIMTTAEYQLA